MESHLSLVRGVALGRLARFNKFFSCNRASLFCYQHIERIHYTTLARTTFRVSIKNTKKYYTQHRGTRYSVVMLTVANQPVMLSVVMLFVVTLSVVAPPDR